MRNLSFKKDGQVNSLAPAIISLVIAATFLILGIIMTGELRDTVNNVAYQMNNETVALINESGTPLDVIDYCNYNTVTLISATNQTTVLAVSTGNFSVNDTGYVTYVALDGKYNNTAVNLTYSFNWGDTACQAANKTVTGLGTFADFWTIIILAIVISIVIGLLLVVFGGGVRRR